MAANMYESFSTLKVYQKGECIFNCNSFDGLMYYLEDGLVGLSLLNVHGMEKTLIVLRPRNIFGETSFGDKPHFCTAKALTDSRVWQFNKESWLKAVQKDPLLALFTINSLTKRIRFLNLEVIHMSFSDAVVKLAFVLDSLFHHLNVTRKDGFPSINVTHEELAKMAGLCRVTITKTINHFKNEGIIKMKGRRLILIDLQKLKDIDMD